MYICLVWSFFKLIIASQAICVSHNFRIYSHFAQVKFSTPAFLPIRNLLDVIVWCSFCTILRILYVLFSLSLFNFHFVCELLNLLATVWFNVKSWKKVSSSVRFTLNGMQNAQFLALSRTPLFWLVDCMLRLKTVCANFPADFGYALVCTSAN